MKSRLRAVLFDLDGTLLANDMRRVFLPRYFELLSAQVGGVMPPDEFVARLMRATEAMVHNDGQATNKEVFDAAFFPLPGRSQAEWQKVFERFYQVEFPKLRPYAEAAPDARRVVQRAFDLGYQVAVATNPLFPEAAIRQRLEWAGVGDLPFELVTHYENSRAAKPNLLYFENILAMLGCEPAESLMIGDEEMDMVAAHLGCVTFWIEQPGVELDPHIPEPTYRGALSDVIPVLEEHAE